MIGDLPKTLQINDKDYDIRWDFKSCLLLMNALNDRDLNDYERGIILLKILYKDYESIPAEHLQEACEQGLWFLNCGNSYEDKHKNQQPPLYDLVKDEQIIFSAINKVAGREIRLDNNLHFWTFMGYFNEIGEGTFATVVSIRDKKRRHKKLEPWEKDFYLKNKSMVDLKTPLTEREKEEMNELNKLLGLEVK